MGTNGEKSAAGPALVRRQIAQRRRLLSAAIPLDSTLVVGRAFCYRVGGMKFDQSRKARRLELPAAAGHAFANDSTDPRSIVRAIWGDADLVLLIFAGSAAEFALNRAVDWLFFTGEVPRDPIGRLFITTRYAQRIAFADAATAQRTLESINSIHHAVERERGRQIPQWAHRDVLYMLIDYSERAHALLRRPLMSAEREALYGYYRWIGEQLHISGVPETYAAWQVDRQRHLHRDLVYSQHTAELYAAYRRQLGAWRYQTLLLVQGMLVPERVRRLLGLRTIWGGDHLASMYRLASRLGSGPLVRTALVPARYLGEVSKLDRNATGGLPPGSH